MALAPTQVALHPRHEFVVDDDTAVPLPLVRLIGLEGDVQPAFLEIAEFWLQAELPDLVHTKEALCHQQDGHGEPDGRALDEADDFVYSEWTAASFPAPLVEEGAVAATKLAKWAEDRVD